MATVHVQVGWPGDPLGETAWLAGLRKRGGAEDAAAAACRSFDELADRKGWPSETGPLTRYERSRLYVRLDECGGLDGWRAMMAAAERSTGLARKQPNFRAFLNDEHFWKSIAARGGAS